MFRRFNLLITSLLAVVGFTATASGGVLLSRQEALELAFPKATRVNEETLILDAEQTQWIQAKTGSRFESDIVSVHHGYQDNRLLGYAIIDVHTVRTLPEAFLIVISPSGTISQLRLLAFYEPQEYLPPDGWLKQFSGKTLNSQLHLRGEIHGIAGSTLTSQAVTASVRRALAIWERFLKKDSSNQESKP